MALVDDSDYENLIKYSWSYHKDGYAHAFVKELGQMKLMHRFILNAPLFHEVDHINRNGLDNQRLNLRLCDRSQNNFNKSTYKNSTTRIKGVRYYRGKYTARIAFRNQRYWLGSFQTAEEAQKAYLEKAAELCREFLP